MLCESSSRQQRWAFTTQMMRHERHRIQALAMLQAADLGITDAKIREADPETTERFRHIVRTLHKEQFFDEESQPVSVDDLSLASIVLSHRGTLGDVEFDTDDESLGTLVWLGLIGPILDALRRGVVLIVDELESSLHPVLVAQLVRIFQNPRVNPNGAQLIFNSFEASLLGNSVDDRVLGRDQVWFTEKRQDGSTTLYPLTDLAPRKAESVGLRYLGGRYGATPIVSVAEFDALAATASAETTE